VDVSSEPNTPVTHSDPLAEYLAGAGKRDADVTEKRNRLFENVGEHELLIRAKEEEVATQASQADVATLGKVIKCQRRIIDAKDKLLVAYRLGARAMPGNALDTIRDQTERLDRLARYAMEKHGGG
jgi:hypothetical protein